jgi:nucleoid DNA-binding protein
MRTRNWLALGSLLGALGLVLALTSTAVSQKPGEEPTITQKLAKAARLTDQQAEKFYSALGPILSAEIRKGKVVNVPGLGSFRVVRIAAHRDLQNGRPVAVPARNSVEFIGGEALMEAANGPDAIAADEVPGFEFIPLPGQTPGQKVGPNRMPGTRTP